MSSMGSRGYRQQREALDQFDGLLRERSNERAFQRLFSEHPYILSNSLPLRLEAGDIQPLARPGRSEPDFVIVPRSTGRPDIYGVIELKRPDSRILSKPRKGVIILSRDAQTAVSQGESYLRDRPTSLVADHRMLILGNRGQIFVIMGLSTELSAKLGDELRLGVPALPANCNLIPYDTLLALFKASIPPQVMVLVPAIEQFTLSEVIAEVERASYSWEYFVLSEFAFSFWQRIEERLGRHLVDWPVMLDMGDYLTRDGALASETDNSQLFMGQILRVIEAANASASHSAIPTSLGTFLGVAKMLKSLDFQQRLRPRARRALRTGFENYRNAGFDTPAVDQNDPAVDELIKLGIARFDPFDIPEASCRLHPLARFAL